VNEEANACLRAARDAIRSGRSPELSLDRLSASIAKLKQAIDALKAPVAEAEHARKDVTER
jgi:hypothetical protein